jgi:hypothetical protein
MTHDEWVRSVLAGHHDYWFTLIFEYVHAFHVCMPSCVAPYYSNLYASTDIFIDIHVSSTV